MTYLYLCHLSDASPSLSSSWSHPFISHRVGQADTVTTQPRISPTLDKVPGAPRRLSLIL